MSYVNQVIILQCDPTSLYYCTLPKKAFLPPSVWPRREYLETQLKGEFTDLFLKFPGCFLFQQAKQEQDDEHFYKVVNITHPYMQVRDSLEDKSMLLVHFKKAFPLTLLGHSFERRAY